MSRRSGLGACLLVLGLAAGLPLLASAAAKGQLGFTGVLVRDQEPQLMEKGLLRSELPVLRGFRSRSALWVLAAPSAAAWQRDVAPRLLAALDAPPEDFGDAAVFLPATIQRAGPDVAGALVHLELPDGAGRGLLAFHLPPLIHEGRGGKSLLNSPAPNKGRFISGVEISGSSGEAERALRSLYLPSWPGAVGRGSLPRVPMRSLPQGDDADFVLFAGEAGEAEQAGPLRSVLWDYASRKQLPTEPMGSFPRSGADLQESLRSIRLEREALEAAEGWYSTLSQAPSEWSFASREVRHPTRYVSLAAPVSTVLQAPGGPEEEHSVVVGLVAFYTPLLLSAREAPLYLGLADRSFFEAVHRGELPFFRDGEDVWFYRGHLDRWARAEGRSVGGKTMARAEAGEQARSWGERWKLRGLDRASRGALPERFEALAEAEREELVDSRVAARARVDRDDLAAWLRHFEPKLKPGDLDPSWSLAFGTQAAELLASFSLEGPWEPPPAAAPAPQLPGASSFSHQWDARSSGSGDGGGAATAELGGEGGDGTALSAVSEGVSLTILDLYSTEGACRTGAESVAALEFDVGGVPEGSVAGLRVEWDLIREGRSVSRDAWSLERGAGSHEVEFSVGCPDEEGQAELYVALLVPGQEELLTETEIPLDVRPPGGRSWPALRMPEPRACLAAVGAEGAADEEGFSMGGSVGLSPEQISSSVRSFQRQTLRCREGRSASGTVQLELTVGCDGRVSESEVLVDGTGDSSFADCVARTFSYASFPAHDMPDGVLFGLPLRYE